MQLGYHGFCPEMWAGMAWAVQHRLGRPDPAGKVIAMGPIQHPISVAALLLMKGTPLPL